MSLLETMTLVNTDSTEIVMSSVGNLQGIEYPEISSVVVSVPGRSGQFYLNSDYEKRVLSWDGLANTLAERRAILGIQIGSLKTLKFNTCDNLSLQADIEITRIIMPAKHGRQKYMIQALAPDYRLLGQELKTASTAVTVVSGGTALPTALPMSFVNVSGTPSLNIHNAGNAYAEPTFTVYGPGTGFVVQNQTTGAVFNLDITLLAGESMVISVKNRTVLKGTTNQYGSFSGDFWELAPGNNQIFFNASSGTDVDTLLSISYRDSYLGV